MRKKFKEDDYIIIILIIFTCIVLFIISVPGVLGCQMLKKPDIFKTMHGNIYDKEFKPYGQIMFKNNQMYLFSVRLIEDKNYTIVAVSGNNITCVKQITSYSTIMSTCNNSFCGGFQYCQNLNKKTNYLKTAKYYLYNSKDINCTTKKIKGKSILQ